MLEITAGELIQSISSLCAHLTTTLNDSPKSKPYKGSLLTIKKALYKRASSTLCYMYGIHKYYFWEVIRFLHCSYDRWTSRALNTVQVIQPFWWNIWVGWDLKLCWPHHFQLALVTLCPVPLNFFSSAELSLCYWMYGLANHWKFAFVAVCWKVQRTQHVGS